MVAQKTRKEPRCSRRGHLIRPSKKDLWRAANDVSNGVVWRLGPKGRWALDNGEPGLAFTAGIMAYYPDVECNCFCFFRMKDCIKKLALDRVFKEHRCANGRPTRPIRARAKKRMS
jgi:hypothetical protein